VDTENLTDEAVGSDSTRPPTALPPTAPEASPTAATPAEPVWRPVVRFLLAGGVSAAICLGLWQLVQHTVTGPTGTIGYPDFANYSYTPPFWAYRLIIYGFPVLLLAGYALLAWRGPLRQTVGHRHTGPVRLMVRASVPPAGVHARPAPGIVARVLCVLLPLVVVVWSAASRSGRYGPFAAAAALAYLAFIALLALGHAWWWARHEQGGLTRDQIRVRVTSAAGPDLAWANGVGGAIAALLGLWFVADHTQVTAAGVGYTLDWLPLWPVLVAIVGVILLALYWGRVGLSTQDIERRMLVLVGAVAIFLTTSILPPAIGVFYGFDDAQELGGAQLLSNGLLPWRDIMFIHGAFPDIFRGVISIAAFGHQTWALPAAQNALFMPAMWVFTYFLLAWASRSNPWLLGTFGVIAVAGFVPNMETRFIFLPLSLIVFGVAMSRRTATWAGILMVVLVAQVALVPETAFLVIPMVICVVLSDIVHRSPGENLWAALRFTRRCAIAGAGAVLLLFVVLASFGAVTGFIQYFTIVGEAHNLTGAIPPTNIGPREKAEIVVGVGVTLLTFWSAVARLRRRGDWQPMDWVCLAAAGFLALYGEKFLGRFDKQHVWQYITVALPLAALWMWKGATVLAGGLRQYAPRSVSLPSWPRLTSAILAVLLVFCVVSAHTPLAPTLRGVDLRHRLSLPYPISDLPGVGFARPNAVDVAMVRDLGTILDTYAGSDQPVYDFTNSVGYVYFLLNRVPGTRFFHVDFAIPPHDQQMVIDELNASRPPVVVFDSDHMGMPIWDGIPNEVRSYQIAQYLLDGWVPILRSHGNLIMLRRDLVKPGLAIPTLLQAPATSDLYIGRTCDWGYAPNFMPAPQQTGTPLTLPVHPMGEYQIVTATGAAIDPATGQAAKSVVVAQGSTVLTELAPSLNRPDLPATTTPVGFIATASAPADQPITFYLRSTDGTLHPLRGTSGAGSVSSLRLSDGSTVPVSATSAGSIDRTTISQQTVGRIDAPAGTNLSAYQLATFAGASLGGLTLTVTNAIGDSSHTISVKTLDDPRTSLALRVGACLQWHGFAGSQPLYVTQTAGAPVTSVTLSGLRD
jgi:hypothetical protein